MISNDENNFNELLVMRKTSKTTKNIDITKKLYNEVARRKTKMQRARCRNTA